MQNKVASSLIVSFQGKPNYLMPFFSLQVFDFIISALTAVGYFSSVPDVRRMIQEATDFPLQKELLHLNPEWLCAILMIAILVCMLLKVIKITFVLNIICTFPSYYSFALP